MNSNMLMMLLPFLLAKNGGSGISPELLSSLMGGGQNPMANLFATLMKNNVKKEETIREETPRESARRNVDVNELFGRDVASVLRTFMEMNGQSGSV